MRVDKKCILDSIPDSVRVRMIRAGLWDEYLAEMLDNWHGRIKTGDKLHIYKKYLLLLKNNGLNVADSSYLMSSFSWSDSKYTGWSKLCEAMEEGTDDKFIKEAYGYRYTFR